MRRIAIPAALLCFPIMLAAASSAPAHGLNLHRLTAPASACAGEDDLHAPVAVQEAAMRCMINFARRQAGVSKLGDSGTLDDTSASKAEDIMRCDQFSHQACGRDFLYWFRRDGYLDKSCWRAGENLAFGTGSLGTARSILKGWLRSPPHRSNMLSGRYDQFGIALRVGALSGRPDAHLWVNHLGGRC
jgi:uncharacterized protein YkwD